MQPIQVPLKSILKYLTLIFLATEFASFVAGKIIQVIEAMPGSVVPLAVFCISFKYAFSDLLQIGSKFGHQVTSLPKFQGCPPG